MAKYQAVLVDQGDIKLSVVSTLNPATLLPAKETGEIHHDCVGIIERTHASQADFKDELITNADLILQMVAVLWKMDNVTQDMQS